MWYHNLFSQILTTSSRHWLLNWIFRTFCIASLTISMNKICILPMFTYSFTNSTWCLTDTDIYISLRRCPCFHGTKANTFLTIAIAYFQKKNTCNSFTRLLQTYDLQSPDSRVQNFTKTRIAPINQLFLFFSEIVKFCFSFLTQCNSKCSVKLPNPLLLCIKIILFLYMRWHY